MTEEEAFNTPTEALCDESETKGYVADIVANEDSPPEKSMKTEAKVAVPPLSNSVESSCY